ncbi:TIGR03668 family PPOX class F420-dependent oxidoreductase [Nocardia veterana]|uniref:TIGR03668 family PPOX class F420-dependent oxidoreductase n=1 Tax=Nocardia veterana TaxID=132249 RepID=A0A7X6RJP7_9NOCA|nr:TIGR03668 family PPOX class F420-dependent oxidoreductase [Nocardia veterana]NKY88430.1 TIGR03668 family PPOX class F420-dependent oxidoreductase [Nocardia veterana]
MPRWDSGTALARLRAARVAHLATADATGQPHLVPVTFALSPDDRILVVAIDQKPKSGTDLRRLRNIAANPRVSVLADHYDEDWTRLWWVRVDGTATVHTEAAERAPALTWLLAKYPQYEHDSPQGPIIAIAVRTVTGWAYTA